VFLPRYVELKIRHCGFAHAVIFNERWRLERNPSGSILNE
jgi:hypothetical protein